MLLYRLRPGTAQNGTNAFDKIQAGITRGCKLLLNSIEKVGELLGTRTDVSKGKTSTGWLEIYTKTGLCCMLENNEFQALDKVCSVVSAFIDRNTEHEKKAPMTTVYTCHSEIVAGVTEEKGKRAWSEEKLDSLERRVKMFRWILV